MPNEKFSVASMLACKQQGRKFTMLSIYDYPTARIASEAGIDSILVGDSLAMTVLGHRDTISVTMDEMLHHVKAVTRGAGRPHGRRRHAVSLLSELTA
jgi:3-methyl-2-oxobutanoate hydroxymethyltransferase